MGAAFNILILAIIALGIVSIAYGTKGVLYGVGWVIVKILSFVQHEMMMRPKERYYRM